MILELLSLFLLQTPPAVPTQAPAAPAVPAGPKDLSEQLGAYAKANDIPAIAALALRGNEIIARGITGVRKRGEAEKASFDDQFHLGSCTKAMTATLAAMLVEEKKLKWNTRLFDVFPELEKVSHPDWKDETLSALLLNRGGMPAELNEGGLWDRLWLEKGPALEQRHILLEGVLKHRPVSQPGTTFLYANANFAVAGAMEETVGGKPWEELMTEKLFKPLGMSSAGFGPPGSASALDQPRGHNEKGDPVGLTGFADNPESISPAGRVHCSISDWSKFIAFHLAGARAVRGLAPDTGTKLLSKESFEMLQTSPEGPDSGYAMGWNVAKRPWGGNVLSHAGSNTMWYCVVWIAPEKNVAFLACCNQGGPKAQLACDAVVTMMSKQILGPLPPQPKPAPPK